MDVTGMRVKWTVSFRDETGRESFMELMIAVVRGSRAVFEEGTRMPSRRGGGLDGIVDVLYYEYRRRRMIKK